MPRALFSIVRTVSLILLGAWPGGGPAASLAIVGGKPPTAAPVSSPRDLPVRDGKPAPTEATTHLPGHERGTTDLAFSPDGAILGSAGLDSTVRLWHVASHRLLHTLHHPDRSVLTIAWAPDGKHLVSSGGNGLICLWDPATGKEVRQLQGHQGAVAALAFSPEGATLASGGDDRTIRLWDPARGSERRSWRARAGEQEWLTGLAFAPDGKQLASAGIRGQALRGILNSIGTSDDISLWDPASGREVQRLPVRGSSVAYAADGRLLAAGGLVHDGRNVGVRVGGVAVNGHELISTVHRGTEGSGAPIEHRGRFVTFAADGRMLGTAGGVESTHFTRLGLGYIGKQPDDRPRLWETLSGQEVGLLAEEPASTLAFSPDGRTVAVATPRGIYLRDLTRIFGAPGEPKDADLAGLWSDLAGPDAARAYRALCRLAAGGDRAVTFLRDQVRPVPLAEAAQVRRLIAQLEHDEFRERQAALTDLRKLGAWIEPALRAALQEERSLESRRQLATLLKEIGAGPWPPDVLRTVRTVQILEQIRTPAACRVLKALAAGAPGTWPTHAAEGALARWARAGIGGPDETIKKRQP